MTESWAAAYDEAVSFLCPRLRETLQNVPALYKETATEARLCLGRAPALLCGGHELCLNADAVTQEDLSECVLALTGYSVQAHQQELAQGFLSAPGGHRAGLAGTAVYAGGQAVSGIRGVNAIVLRIAHKGGAQGKRTAEALLANGLSGLLLAGAPGSGKTTLLRQLGETLAERGTHAVLIDERGELSASEGLCRLTGYPKALGILMALRALSPQAILCDELGGEEDARSVLWALNCGVPVIGTAHAASIPELFRRRGTALLLESGAFPRAALLDEKRPGEVKEVYEHVRAASDGGRPAAAAMLDGGRIPVGNPLQTADCGAGGGDPVPCDAAAKAPLLDGADRTASAVCV